jgi:hypothetical protein
MRMSLGLCAAALCLLAVDLEACGGNSNEPGPDSGSGTSDAGGRTDAGMSSSDAGPPQDAGAGDGGLIPQPLQVQVVDLGGPVLTALNIQLIGYAEDPFLPEVERFITEYNATGAWSTQVGEYGIHPFVQLPPVVIPGTPPAQIDDNTGNPTPLMQMIASAVSHPDSGWAPEDGGTMYMLLLPQGTQVNSGGLCCDPTQGYFGYHYQAPLGSSYIPYAVVCNCVNFVQPPLSALDEVTSTVNHEMVEAATDPFSSTSPAYVQEDNADIIWGVFSFGGELGDMCENNSDSTVPMDGGTYDGGTYMIQRTWSNAAARAGDNPCVPAPPTPYFNSYAVYSDSISLSGSDFGGTVATTGVFMTVGQTRTIPIRLWSNAPTGPWTVTATT